MYTSWGIHFLLSSSNFVWCGTCWNLIAVWKSVDSETPKKFQIGHSALFFLSILRFSHQLKIGYLMIVLNTIITVSQFVSYQFENISGWILQYLGSMILTYYHPILYSYHFPWPDLILSRCFAILLLHHWFIVNSYDRYLLYLFLKFSSNLRFVKRNIANILLISSQLQLKAV